MLVLLPIEIFPLSALTTAPGHIEENSPSSTSPTTYANSLT